MGGVSPWGLEILGYREGTHWGYLPRNCSWKTSGGLRQGPLGQGGFSPRRDLLCPSPLPAVTKLLSALPRPNHPAGGLARSIPCALGREGNQGFTHPPRLPPEPYLCWRLHGTYWPALGMWGCSLHPILRAGGSWEGGLASGHPKLVGRLQDRGAAQGSQWTHRPHSQPHLGPLHVMCHPITPSGPGRRGPPGHSFPLTAASVDPHVPATLWLGSWLHSHWSTQGHLVLTTCSLLCRALPCPMPLWPPLPAAFCLTASPPFSPSPSSVLSSHCRSLKPPLSITLWTGLRYFGLFPHHHPLRPGHRAWGRGSSREYRTGD